MKLKPLPDRQRPLIFAHRGLSSEAPENTMAAFNLANKYGIPGVELDIHLTKDGHLVIVHDYNTARVAPDTNLVIEQSTLSELKAIDIGSWKDAKYHKERISLLAELFEELGDKLYFDVEIKSDTSNDYGLEQKLGNMLNDFKYGAERIVVSSFNPIAIKRFKHISPNIPTAIIYCTSSDVPWYLRHGEGRYIAKADFLKPRHTQVTKLGLAWSNLVSGRKIIPWTIDDSLEAARVLKLGCDGVISNKPHELGIQNKALG